VPQLSSLLPWELARTKWSSAINPLLANLFTQGVQISNVQVSTTQTTIPHKLGRLPVGWIVTDANAGVMVYRSANFNDSTLSLTASGTATISLWVY
jgi:hypothetical protein